MLEVLNYYFKLVLGFSHFFAVGAFFLGFVTFIKGSIGFWLYGLTISIALAYMKLNELRKAEKNPVGAILSVYILVIIILNGAGIQSGADFFQMLNEITTGSAALILVYFIVCSPILIIGKLLSDKYKLPMSFVILGSFMFMMFFIQNVHLPEPIRIVLISLTSPSLLLLHLSYLISSEEYLPNMWTDRLMLKRR